MRKTPPLACLGSALTLGLNMDAAATVFSYDDADHAGSKPPFSTATGACSANFLTSSGLASQTSTCTNGVWDAFAPCDSEQ